MSFHVIDWIHVYSRLSTSLFLIALFAVSANGQDLLKIQRLTAPVELDGLSDEEAWAGVAPLELTMYSPIEAGVMTERTEIRVAYDDDYLYIAGRMYDSTPSEIRANTLYRDRYSGDDTFAIVLDTYNDNENALWFYTSPNGVRFDTGVSGDSNSGGGGGGGSFGFGGGSWNDSWNTYWDVKTVINQEGWFAEMRIPYSSLGFLVKDGAVEMGMITYRYIARKGERHIFPAIPPNWRSGFTKPSQAQKIELRGIESQKPVYFTPYVAEGRTSQNQLNDAGTAYRSKSDLTKQVGLDLKYAVTNNLTVDATFNTDFAQVEADDQQVNLSRFSLFFPEKRQFFQERSSLFDFSTGRRDRLFHSRNIGIRNGETVRIIAGARMVGRVGAWDLGVIDMQTESSEGAPAENFGVVRMRRQVVNEQSFAGGIVTSRLGGDGSYNIAYGLDGTFRVAPNTFVETKWAQTFDQDLIDEKGFNVLQTGLFSSEFNRQKDIGFSFMSGLIFAGADYNPRSGYVTRTDYTYLNFDLQNGWLSPELSALRQHDGSIFGNVYLRNSDGSLESARFGGSWDFAYKSSASARTSVNVIIEDLTEGLSFPKGLTVPAAQHTYVEWQSNYSVAGGSLFRGRVSTTVGSFYDGWQLKGEYSPTWNINKHIELAGSISVTHLEFPDRNQKADISLIGLRAQLGFTTQVSVNTFIQYNAAADRIASNVRFRYNFAEGNDLWVVYTDNLNTNRQRNELELPVSSNRTVLLKYTYTFGS